ncbi:hypothetical protein [Streptacidiphilus anmyonensis]|uniref:hypothetical protein n=1 Tax=Streptacidiphilus anmyonensis TaxID=405782 RepID=UPI0005A94FCD|nr:hypothetical protein [Streptacidiphilus anmyonensis]
MTPTQVTAALREALFGEDMLALFDLLPTEVLWSPGPTDLPVLTARPTVIEWYRQLRARGARTTVGETFTYPDAVVLGLAWEPGGSAVRYHLFRLVNGRVTLLQVYDDRYEALVAAYRTV